MAGKALITNPGQFGSLGATWNTASVDTQMTSYVEPVLNNTGLVLYVGDIVCLDATGTTLVLAGGAADTTVIGTVADPRHQSTIFPLLTSGTIVDTSIGYPGLGGSFQPGQDSATTTQTVGFTNGNLNATSALVSTNNPLYLGAYVYPPASAYASAANIQIFQVATNGGSSGAWTATLVVVSGANTASFQGTTGSYASLVGDSAQSLGPGWRPQQGWTASSGFANNAIVPVCLHGFGRVNINGVAGTVKGDMIAVAGASVVGARTAAAAATAAQIGTFIATTLEAYAARDTTLTTAGITGHDTVRCIVGKF